MYRVVVLHFVYFGIFGYFVNRVPNVPGTAGPYKTVAEKIQEVYVVRDDKNKGGALPPPLYVLEHIQRMSPPSAFAVCEQNLGVLAPVAMWLKARTR